MSESYRRSGAAGGDKDLPPRRRGVRSREGEGESRARGGGQDRYGGSPPRAVGRGGAAERSPRSHSHPRLARAGERRLPRRRDGGGGGGSHTRPRKCADGSRPTHGPIAERRSDGYLGPRRVGLSASADTEARGPTRDRRLERAPQGYPGERRRSTKSAAVKDPGKAETGAPGPKAMTATFPPPRGFKDVENKSQAPALGKCLNGKNPEVLPRVEPLVFVNDDPCSHPRPAGAGERCLPQRRDGGGGGGSHTAQRKCADESRPAHGPIAERRSDGYLGPRRVGLSASADTKARGPTRDCRLERVPQGYPGERRRSTKSAAKKDPGKAETGAPGPEPMTGTFPPPRGFEDVENKSQAPALGKCRNGKNPEVVPRVEPLIFVHDDGAPVFLRTCEQARGRRGYPRSKKTEDPQETDPPQVHSNENGADEECHRHLQPPGCTQLSPPERVSFRSRGAHHPQSLGAHRIPQVRPEPSGEESQPTGPPEDPLPVLTAFRVPSEREEYASDTSGQIVVAMPVKKNLWVKASVAALILVLVGVILGITLREKNGVPPTSDPFTNQTLQPPTRPPQPLTPNSTVKNELRSSICQALPSSCLSLSNETSPQHRALAWLALDPRVGSYSFEKKMQRFALAVLYYSTKGWDMISGSWVDHSVDECEWFKVNCTHNMVSEILLGRILSGGTLPREVALFNISLKSLYLDNNELSGIIPTEYGMLTNLQHLFLNQNSLWGTVPSELGRLTSLRTLSVRSNELRGSVPEEICNLRAGGLESLWADCKKKCSGCAPRIYCGCCTMCCDESTCSDTSSDGSTILDASTQTTGSGNPDAQAAKNISSKGGF